MKVTRRNIINLGALGAGIYGVSTVVPWMLPARAFDFTPVDSPGGFRRIARSDGLSAGQFLTGLEDPASRLPPLSQSDICRLTFAGHPNGQGQLAIAVFSDFFCPYCRVLDLQVRDLAAQDARIEVVPHEVPLLGVPSQWAARAVIAAEGQGAYAAFHNRLIRTTFVPNPAYLRSVAAEEGLDVAQFEQDLRSPQTDRRLQTSAALFRAFGFAGTPALAVGRTLVNGTISRADLRALVQLELAEQGSGFCS